MTEILLGWNIPSNLWEPAVLGGLASEEFHILQVLREFLLFQVAHRGGVEGTGLTGPLPMMGVGPNASLAFSIRKSHLAGLRKFSPENTKEWA